MKRRPTEWENISANDMTDKGLLSNIYKQLIQLNTKNTKQPDIKMGRRTEQTFFQRGNTDGQQAYENVLNIANIKEMQIKTTMRYHLTPFRMAIIKKDINNNVGEDVEKREPSYTVGGNVSWCSHCGKQYGCFSKK